MGLLCFGLTNFARAGTKKIRWTPRHLVELYSTWRSHRIVYNIAIYRIARRLTFRVKHLMVHLTATVAEDFFGCSE